MDEQQAREVQELLGPALAGELTEICPNWRELEPEAVQERLGEHMADLRRQADATLDTLNALGPPNHES